MRRSERVRLWARWAGRDARARWVQVASIALLLALGVGMYSAMSSMSSWRTASATASFEALKMHDIRASLPDGSFVREGRLRAALAGIPDAAEVGAAAERLVVPTQVDAATETRDVRVPGRLVGAPLAAGVDELHVARGRAPRPDEQRAPAGLLERNFGDHYELPDAGTVELTGGRELRYTGQADSPQYFVVTAPGADFGGDANLAVMFTSLATAQRLSGRPGNVNELVLRLRPGADADAVQAQLAAALRRDLPRTGVEFTRAEQEPAWRLLFKDAEGDQQLMDVFAYLLLGAAVFGAFNLASRVVDAQRREIGIGMALGVEPRALAIRPLLLGAQIAFLGVALGIPAGIAANAWLRSVIETFFPLPVVQTPFQAQYFVRGAAVGVLLPILAAALPVRRALRVAPIDAIRVGSRSARSSGLAWLLKGVRIPGGSLANLPLRNVLRTPRRTALTTLGIAAVVSIVVALSGMIDSFDNTLAASRDETLAGSRDRLTVDLRQPQRPGSPLVRRIADARSVGTAEASLRLPVTIRSHGREIKAYMDVVDPAARLWRPTFDAGGLPPGRPSVAIADRAAGHLGVGVGDVVAVEHPVPTGPSSFQLASTRLPVTGINASPFRFVAYAGQASAPALQVPGLVNRVSVVPAPGSDATAVKRELLRIPGIAAVQGASAITDAVDEEMDRFTDVLVVSAAIAVVMAMLIAFNSSAINADERVREHATMFAYGVAPSQVTRGNVVEALVVGAIGTAVGIALGWAVLVWITASAVSETMPDLGMLLTVAPVTYAVAVAGGTVAVALAPLLTVRRLRRTDIPASLRVVE